MQTENQTLLNNRESETEENSVASASSPIERSEYVNEGTPINLLGNTPEDIDFNLALQNEETGSSKSRNSGQAENKSSEQRPKTGESNSSEGT